MILTSLELIQFRNHSQARFNFSAETNLIVGANAAGKSNVLEAIWLLSSGESFRAGKIEEMVNWGEEVGHVQGKITNSQITNDKLDDEVELRVTVTRGMVQGRRTQKRLFKINGAARRRQDYVGELAAVLFRPEDMNLVSGEPVLKRRFMDEVLCQTDQEYRRSLESYIKGLKQRNGLLDQIREGRTSKTALIFWDQLLLKEGSQIQEKRSRFIEQVNQLNSPSKQLRVEYVESVISQKSITTHLEAEIALGYTLTGPHKDDLKVYEEKRSLAVYGSRGEQRMAVLWLKQAQLTVMEQVLGYRPLLLLDDILSELDHHHMAEVVSLASMQQTILTTTDEALGDYFGKQNRLIRL